MATTPADTASGGLREIRHFIDGRTMPSASGRRWDNICPVDGRIIGSVHEAGRAEVDAAVNAAGQALHGDWARLTLEQRCTLLHKVADGIMARFDEFVDAECADTGKPCSMARMVDIPRGSANLRIFADMVKGVGAESFLQDTPDGRGAMHYGVRVPKGVIGVICPWNLPLLLMTWKVGPALACGNTVVVKPSEQTPTTATLLGEVMRDAGVPDGVYNVVHGFGPESAGAFLVEHPGIDAITFTGETRTGEAIMRSAATGMRDVSFELGGKNPAVIFADCDLDRAVEGSLRSVFTNCGQVCLCTERLYVQRPVFEKFLSRLKAGAEAIRMGAPNDEQTQMGPLISQAHRDKVLSYYQQAVALGAEVVTGGGVPDMPEELAAGAWVQPTIWTGLSEHSAIQQEEIFGPCCHVTPFDDEDEAVAMANDTRYGLACSVWSENTSRASRVARQIEAGVIWVNTWFLRDLRTPFGGMKQSGIGREGGRYSLDFYTELKNVCVKL